MPSNTKDWIQKADSFKAKRGTFVCQLTVMLQCFGYSGTVMFSDVEIKPLSCKKFEFLFNFTNFDDSFCLKLINKDDKIAKVDDCRSKGDKMGDDWNKGSSFIHHRVERLKLDHFDDQFDRETDQNDQITLMTQLSMDRIQILARTLTFWQGPVSLAIYIPIKSLNESLLDWQR